MVLRVTNRKEKGMTPTVYAELPTGKLDRLGAPVKGVSSFPCSCGRRATFVCKLERNA